MDDINDQKPAAQDMKFSLLSTFYNKIDDNVNFFITIGSELSGSGFRGLEVLFKSEYRILNAEYSAEGGSK